MSGWWEKRIRLSQFWARLLHENREGLLIAIKNIWPQGADVKFVERDRLPGAAPQVDPIEQRLLGFGHPGFHPRPDRFLSKTKKQRLRKVKIAQRPERGFRSSRAMEGDTGRLAGF